ncbi:DISARM system helicase DrmA [Roseospira goensis]|uniref:Helicase n=1 Tax=Roseospira goensis TaxID=391922 RepID=A0A7W6WLZ3_9PROT|nr:DISARM system helicase DrmA [Roseospira goensis]MBB4287233.1 hypothetical protein [Roseospira goensis]
MTTPSAIRSQLVDVLRRDLVGPAPQPTDADLARERLKEPPSRWYLTGFIAPAEDPVGAADDPTMQEDRETLLETEDTDASVLGDGAADDEAADDTPAAKRRFLPSSVGLTVLVDRTVSRLQVRATWGDYVTEPPLPTIWRAPEATDISTAETEDSENQDPFAPDWIRQPGEAKVTIDVAPGAPARTVLPGSAAPMGAGGALVLESVARPTTIRMPEGHTREVLVVTLFLVNRRRRPRSRHRDVSYAFQARLDVFCDAGFAPRLDLSDYRSTDHDLRVADLHYRNEEDFATGRNTATDWTRDPTDGVVRHVWTTPLPLAEVDRIAPNEAITDVAFDAEALAALADGTGEALGDALAPLPDQYGTWIGSQVTEAASLLAPRRRETGETLVTAMRRARDRIAEGIRLLREQPRARQAFAIANRAVSRAHRQRIGSDIGQAPETVAALRWRPFQLAFVLLNLPGLVKGDHPDRETVDLLFFPTGGGKTEAYLGLAAFAIAHRRLSASGVLGAGVTVIMRYTLRLLTLDQLSRAAGVVCALELARTDPALVDAQGRPVLGDWPIEIGLWVGSAATPNVLGGRGNTGNHTAVTQVRRFKRTGEKPPAPLKTCPWCGTAFSRQSFDLVPNAQTPHNLEIRCANTACDFTGDRPLPIVTVDDAIYRRLPAFLIATVDKFAALPWIGETGHFFGHVDRFEADLGFFGAADDPRAGRPLFNGSTLEPPALIIQDELHLISGPLGTVAALYETAIDRLASRVHDGGRVRPKIVASTATVRQASEQIRLLFDRTDTAVFPPPGIDRTDSFFARTVRDEQNPPRWYVGLAAQGRGPKLVFLRTLNTLTAAGMKAFEEHGAAADPYMTALCYFNSLRELGGARRIVEDEVRNYARGYGRQRRRLAPPDAPFADRHIGEPLELTSRVSTDDVAQAKTALSRPFSLSGARVDVALATNMISVGLDISRLGVMVVQGQPKTAAEYIQSTSRVGRDAFRPGLVLTILNLHKPRDRTHYEGFGAFHRSFYRSVEATTVTPWAPRALDRALAAIVVAIGRHIDSAMTAETAVGALSDNPDVRTRVIDAIVSRVPDEDCVVGGKGALRTRVADLLDAWTRTADDLTAQGTRFSYSHRGGRRHLLYAPLDPLIKDESPDHQNFVAGWSMRDVEGSVYLKVMNPWGQPLANADDLD